MADNITLLPGVGGATLAADEIGGISFQRVKLTVGSDGTADDVDSSHPIPVTNASLPLPTGASTLAEQQTQTTAIAAIKTAVETIDNAIAGNEMQVDVLTMPTVTVQDGGSSLTVDSAQLPVALAANGGLKVEGVAGGVAIPISVATIPSHAVTNAGTFATQVDGAALTALQLIDDTIKVDDAVFTPGTSSVSMAGFQADESSTDSVDEGDAGAARMTLDRKVIMTPQPHTVGGLAIFRSLDLDETEEDVKTSAGQVYGWYIANLRSTPLYLKWYNDTAANVSVGSTTPVMTFVIPANSTSFVAGNALGAHGIAFSAAICVAATTGLADADTGAPGANECVVNIFYK